MSYSAFRRGDNVSRFQRLYCIALGDGASTIVRFKECVSEGALSATLEACSQCPSLLAFLVDGNWERLRDVNAASVCTAISIDDLDLVLQPTFRCRYPAP